MKNYDQTEKWVQKNNYKRHNECLDDDNDLSSLALYPELVCIVNYCILDSKSDENECGHSRNKQKLCPDSFEERER